MAPWKWELWVTGCAEKGRHEWVTTGRGKRPSWQQDSKGSTKKKSEVKILVISHWRFAILRHTVYQKSLFWTEICKEPNGHVRYIQNLPCTIFSHTHKTADDDNHRHKLLQMAHVSPIPIVQQRWGSTFQALARTKVECVLPADTEHKGLLTLGSSTADMDRSTMSLQCDAQTPHTSVAFNQA